ncbi:MAG: hypothetical protein K1X87_02265 [Dehalococcoidia bacterium]|nr:hypothetical protein [Dehalococcoidia bacterium]
MSWVIAFTDPGSVYPVIDPRRFGGDRPLMFGYGFAQDLVRVDLRENPNITNCQMLVDLEVRPSVALPKNIQAWNYASGTVSSIHAGGAMLLNRADGPVGTHTLLLNGLYSFRSSELWDLWGGYTVTFRWIRDVGFNGQWGSQTSAPTYSTADDGLLIRGSRHPERVFVMFGRAKFRIDARNALGFDVNSARIVDQETVDSLTSMPADYTVLRDRAYPTYFVCFGGARFPFRPGDPLLNSNFPVGLDLHLGFTDVRIQAAAKTVPDGASNSIPRVPRDGTLLRDAGDPASNVYLVQGGLLRRVASPAAFAANCLATRNIRTVPAGSLTSLPHGADLT